MEFPLAKLLRSLAFVLILTSLCVQGTMGMVAAKQQRPNIVLILADDLGYGDCGCYGQARLKTPHIDKLSQQGMRWTQFYAGSTVCAPSRCVLMTGKHTGRCLIRGNSKESLPANERTFAQVLQEAGYRCGLFGKWGLGQAGTSGSPLNKGFDRFFGYLDQTHAHNFFPTFLDEDHGRRDLRNVVTKESPSGAGVATKKIDDASELIVDEAIRFVDQNRDKPFFLFFSLNLPHANNEAGNAGTQEFGFGNYADRDWPDAEKGFAHMVEKMDTQIGQLVDHIDALGLAESTLILFSSDNGPHHEGGHKDTFFGSSGILRGSKRSLTEGGIRVPTIARWKGKIKEGSKTDQIGCFDDLFPTFAQIAEQSDKIPGDVTGVSLLPSLLGAPDQQRQRDFLYWSFYEGGHGQALRHGNWKLVEQPLGTKPKLYRLDQDPGEAEDLASSEPAQLANLQKMAADAYQPGNPPWTLRDANKKNQ